MPENYYAGDTQLEEGVTYYTTTGGKIRTYEYDPSSPEKVKKIGEEPLRSGSWKKVGSEMKYVRAENIDSSWVNLPSYFIPSTEKVEYEESGQEIGEYTRFKERGVDPTFRELKDITGDPLEFRHFLNQMFGMKSPQHFLEGLPTLGASGGYQSKLKDMLEGYKTRLSGLRESAGTKIQEGRRALGKGGLGGMSRLTNLGSILKGYRDKASEIQQGFTGGVKNYQQDLISNLMRSIGGLKSDAKYFE